MHNSIADRGDINRPLFIIFNNKGAVVTMLIITGIEILVQLAQISFQKITKIFQFARNFLAPSK